MCFLFNLRIRMVQINLNSETKLFYHIRLIKRFRSQLIVGAWETSQRIKSRLILWNQTSNPWPNTCAQSFLNFFVYLNIHTLRYF